MTAAAGGNAGPAPTGVVLAGGASSRMGTDKAFVEVDGIPMARRVAEALRSAGCRPVWCQGGDVARFAGLGLSVRADPDGRRGPVAAIAAALAAAETSIVVAACDLPRLDAATVRAVIDASAAHRSVAVAVADGRCHLLSVWPRHAEGALAAALGSGLVAYRDVVRAVGAVEVDVDAGTVANVNRPDDLEGGVHGSDGRSAPAQGYPRPSMTVQEISVDELAERIADGARLVDVREPDEYEEARVAGAVLVPLATVPSRLDAFDGDGPTYVICRSGGRSMQACRFLADRGIEAINVAGGTLAWLASGRDVEVGPA